MQSTLEPFISATDRCDVLLALLNDNLPQIKSHPDRYKYAKIVKKALQFWREYYETDDLCVIAANNMIVRVSDLVDDSTGDVRTCLGVLAMLKANLAEDTAHDDEAFLKIKGPEFAWRSFAVLAALSTRKVGHITHKDLIAALGELSAHFEMQDILTDEVIEFLAYDTIGNDDGRLFEQVGEHFLTL
jgi:hypothetical protein